MFSRVNLCGLCLLIFIVAPVCFSSHPAIFYIEAALSFFLSGFLWTSVVCCISKLSLDLRILLSTCWHLFPLRPQVTGFGLHQRSILPLQTPGQASPSYSSKHHYEFLRTPVPLVAFVGELHGGEDCFLQLAREFLQVLTSAVSGRVRVCLVVQAWFIISSTLEDLSVRLLHLQYML